MDTPLQQMDADIAWQIPQSQTLEQPLTRAAQGQAVSQLGTRAFKHSLVLLASAISFLPFLAVNMIIGLVIAGKTLGMSPSLLGMILLLLIATTIPLLLTLESLKTTPRHGNS